MSPRAVFFVLLLVVPSGAEAELYRCTDAAGNVSYTGDPHSCRGSAARHETQRQIQSTGPGATAKPASPRRRSQPRARGVEPEDGGAALWQRKKRDAENQLREIDSELPRWVRFQARCNRGADAWYTDEAGIKHTVTCSQLAELRNRAEAEQSRLRAYLAGGLEEECRRSGCLPGWIR